MDLYKAKVTGCLEVTKVHSSNCLDTLFKTLKSQIEEGYTVEFYKQNASQQVVEGGQAKGCEILKCREWNGEICTRDGPCLFNPPAT